MGRKQNWIYSVRKQRSSKTCAQYRRQQLQLLHALPPLSLRFHSGAWLNIMASFFKKKMEISSSWFLATRSDSSEIQSENIVGKRCQREKYFSSTHCFLQSVSKKLVSLPYSNFYWLCAVATSVHNPWACNLTTTITGRSLLFPISCFQSHTFYCFPSTAFHLDTTDLTPK